MSIVADNRLPAFLVTLKELIADKESNETIEICINKFFGSDVSQLIDNRDFVYNFFSQFIYESLTKDQTLDRMSLNESLLSKRSKILANYREYQLNLLLVLCDIKINLGLSDSLFDAIIRTLHQNGVLSEDASNHWFHCKSGFVDRMKIIQCCASLLQMSQAAREDFFFMCS